MGLFQHQPLNNYQTMRTSTLLVLVLTVLQAQVALSILGGPARAVGGLIRRIFRRRTDFEGPDGQDDFAQAQQILELRAENDVLRDQIYSLKRLATSQKNYALQLRKDKESLRRALESAVAETEQRLSEQFSADNARALKEQQEKFEDEKSRLKADLKEAKAELKAVGQKLKAAQITIEDVKAQLKRESERAASKAEAAAAAAAKEAVKKAAAAAAAAAVEEEEELPPQKKRKEEGVREDEGQKVKVKQSKSSASRESRESSSGSRYSEKKARVRVKNNDSQ